MPRRFSTYMSVVAVASLTATTLAVPQAIAKTKASPTVITLWHEWTGGFEIKEVHQMVTEFNQTHPTIQVKDLPATTDQKMLTAMTGGTPPDVAITANAPSIVGWAKVGALQPLDTYMKQTSRSASEFPSALLAPGQFKGNIYGLPVETDTYMLFYNKKLFKAAGITSPPKTFEELQKDAWKLTKRGPGGYKTVGFIPDYPWLDATLLPSVFGGKFMNSKGQLTPDDPKVLQALQFERSFYQAPYNFTDIQKFKSGFGKYGSPNDPFMTGQLAMIWMGEWWPKYIQIAAPNLDYGIAPMPYPAGHPELKNTTTTTPEMIFIPRNAAYQDAAWTFINWFTQKKQLVEFNAALAGLPTTYASLKDPQLVKLNPPLKPFANLLVGGHLAAFPNVSYQNEYLNDLGVEEQKAIGLQETAQQAMQKVKSEIEPVAKNSEN